MTFLTNYFLRQLLNIEMNTAKHRLYFDAKWHISNEIVAMTRREVVLIFVTNGVPYERDMRTYTLGSLV